MINLLSEIASNNKYIYLSEMNFQIITREGYDTNME